MERPPMKKPFELSAQDAKAATQPAAQGMSQSSNYDWAIGCNIHLKTTLGEEMTGKVFAYDRLTNCLTLVEKGDSPGLVNYRVLKATFIKEVLSAQRPTNPPDMHLPSVDLHEVFRREEMALDMPPLASHIAETAINVPNRSPVDPSTEERQALGQGIQSDEPPSSPTARATTNGSVAEEGSPALQEPPQEPVMEPAVFKTRQPRESQPQSSSPELQDSEQPALGGTTDGHPSSDLVRGRSPPMPGQEPNVSAWKEQVRKVSPPKLAVQQSTVTSKPSLPAVQGLSSTRPWGPGHTAGGALSKTSAPAGPSTGLSGLSKVASGAENNPGTRTPATAESGSGNGPPAGPTPSVATKGLQGRWARGRPKITRDP